MDAHGMVKLSRTWKTVPIQERCEIPASHINKLIPSKSQVTLPLEVKQSDCPNINFLEHVQAKVTLAATRRGDIQIFLTSPAGTRSTLLALRPKDAARSGFNAWPFMTVHSWGESPIGLWQLEIHNEGRYLGPFVSLLIVEPLFRTSIAIWGLTLYGTKESPDGTEPAKNPPYRGGLPAPLPPHGNEISIVEHDGDDPDMLRNGSCRTVDSVSGLCLGCSEGHILMAGKCLDSCPVGTYLLTGEESSCQPCHYSCRTCIGPLPFLCKSCWNDASLHPDSRGRMYCHPRLLISEMKQLDRGHSILAVGFGICLIFLASLLIFVLTWYRCKWQQTMDSERIRYSSLSSSLSPEYIHSPGPPHSESTTKFIHSCEDSESRWELPVSEFVEAGLKVGEWRLIQDSPSRIYPDSQMPNCGERLDLEEKPQVQKVTSVSVKVVLKSGPRALRSMNLLNKGVGRLLQSFHFVPGSILCCGDHPVAQRLAIDTVIVDGVDNILSKSTIIYRLSRGGEVHISQTITKDRFQQIQDAEKVPKHWNMDLVKHVEEMLSASTINQGILLTGPSGCGKHHLVRLVATRQSAFLVVVQPDSDLQRLKHYVADILSQAAEGKTILFLRDVDSICPYRDASGRNSDGRRRTTYVMGAMDTLMGKGVWILGSSERPQDIDPAIRRNGRLGHLVQVKLPNAVERREILREEGIEEAVAEAVALHTASFSPSDLRHLIACAIQQAAFQSRVPFSGKLTQEDFDKVLPRVSPSILTASSASLPSSFSSETSSWDSLGGLHPVKARLRLALELPIKHPAAFRRLGILLVGEPGCGKTSLVRAVASCFSHLTCFSLSPASVLSPYVGDSEKFLSETFQHARIVQPSLIFLDEIDVLTGSRNQDSGKRSVHEKLLSTLLNEMDGISSSSSSQVVVVGATNRVGVIDEALRRPGRLDWVLEIPVPDERDRLDILRVLTRRSELDVDVCLETLARLTRGMNGSRLASLTREVSDMPFTLLQPFHIIFFYDSTCCLTQAGLRALEKRGFLADSICMEDFLSLLKSHDQECLDDS
ncbi:unnamed protein product, partial [Darwinula stevensoni]